MGTWRKTLGLVAGGLAGLGGWIANADAQYPPGASMPPMMGMPGGAMPPMMAMPGSPAMPPTMNMPPGMGTPAGGMAANGGGFTPGAFGGGAPPGGAPADFPNASQPSGEPASPFSIKDDGMPNAFTILNDPRRRMPDPYFLTFSGSYLLWHISDAGSSAILATTTTGTPSATNFGALGQSNTTALVPAGADTVDYRTLSGYKLAMGIACGFLPPMEISGFFFNRNQTVFSSNSFDSTGTFVTRPFSALDQAAAPGIGSQNAFFVNIPGLLNGSMSIVSRMSFWNVEANFLCMFCDTDTFNLSAIVGYRHTDLYESLEIKNSSGGNVALIAMPFDGFIAPPGASVTILDNFRTHNSFDGGQIGMRGVVNLFEKINIFTDLKVAAGNVHESLAINGSTTLNQNIPTAVSQTQQGGLLALPSNIGERSINRFGIIPEADLTLSYQIHSHIRLFGGYNIMYWNSVLRPGDHINPNIDTRQVPGSPTFTPNTPGIAPGPPALSSRSLWANGYTFGIEIGF